MEPLNQGSIQVTSGVRDVDLRSEDVTSNNTVEPHLHRQVVPAPWHLGQGVDRKNRNPENWNEVWILRDGGVCVFFYFSVIKLGIIYIQ